MFAVRTEIQMKFESWVFVLAGKPRLPGHGGENWLAKEIHSSCKEGFYAYFIIVVFTFLTQVIPTGIC
jgi:hypothetical protein